MTKSQRGKFKENPKEVQPQFQPLSEVLTGTAEWDTVLRVRLD